MATLVLTVIGDDKSGLVDALSGIIRDNGGNWERSQMAQLAGKFAGIVVVTVPDQSAEALIAALGPLADEGLLDVTAERASEATPGAPGSTRLELHLLGTDQPGIIRNISHVLATHEVSIEELTTDTRSAPMAGGVLFEAKALLDVPPGVSLADLRLALENLAGELMVDIDLDA